MEAVGFGATSLLPHVDGASLPLMGGGDISFGMSNRLVWSVGGTYLGAKTFNGVSELRFRLSSSPKARALGTMVWGAGAVYVPGEPTSLVTLGAHTGLRGSIAIVEQFRLTGGITLNASSFVSHESQLGLQVPVHAGFSWRQRVSRGLALIAGLETSASIQRAPPELPDAHPSVGLQGLLFLGFATTSRLDEEDGLSN